MLDLADVGQLYTLDRPDLKYEPWVPFTQRRLAKPDRRRPLRRDREPRHPRAAPVRLVRDQRRGVRPRRRRRSAGRDAEDDRVPHRPGLGPRAGADGGGRERHAERLRRRAEGPVRRAPQHRMGARARAGGRARRLRVPGHEDPREDDARRPPRRRPAAALRAHRHRQLPRDHGPGTTRTSASSPPTRTSPPTSPTSSTSSRASGARRSSASCSSRRSTSSGA